MFSPVNVIGDVTHALELLLVELTPSLGSPANLVLAEGETGSVNIYLYQVLESPHGKNRSWSTRPNGDREYPPLQLKLYYMLTPYAGDLLTEHHILGDTMRTLYDNAILRGTDLPESLRLHVDQIAIALMPLQLEELTRIWSALQSAYRLSVAYEVRVVPVQSDFVQRPSRVLTKVDLYAQT
jgi:hypothetical protein